MDLSPIQRIAVTEKYRPIYEKQAKENSLNNLKQNQTADKSNLTNREFKSTNKKLADIAGVKPTTYKMGAKVLNSDNEDLKQRVLSGETSISAGYKELQNEKKKEQFSDNQNGEYNIEQPTTSSSTVQPSQKNQVSDEVKQICEEPFDIIISKSVCVEFLNLNFQKTRTKKKLPENRQPLQTTNLLK